MYIIKRNANFVNFPIAETAIAMYYELFQAKTI